jgi:uncharacterized protein (DUF427 family)
VWDYPRPPVAERTDRWIIVRHHGQDIANSRQAFRTLETSHPPSYYLPPSDVAMDLLGTSSHASFCEWKGSARYFDVMVGDDILRNAAWSYPRPSPPFAKLADHIAFYPALFDECLIDGEAVLPQPGGFYGGWITSCEAGPFKGVRGSAFW